MPVAALPHSSSANNHSTYVALLSVFCVFIVLAVVKMLYIKHRRLHTIHCVPLMYSPASADTSMSLADATEHRASNRDSYLVGFFGSPSWEANIQVYLDSMARQERRRTPQSLGDKHFFLPSLSSHRIRPSYLGSPSFGELSNTSQSQISRTTSWPSIPEALYSGYQRRRQSSSSAELGSIDSPTFYTANGSYASIGQVMHISNVPSRSSRTSSSCDLSGKISVKLDGAQFDFPDIPSPPPMAISIPSTPHYMRPGLTIGDTSDTLLAPTQHHPHKYTSRNKSAPSLRTSILRADPENKENEFGEKKPTLRKTTSHSVVRRSRSRPRIPKTSSSGSQPVGRLPFASIAQTLNAEPLLNPPRSLSFTTSHPIPLKCDVAQSKENQSQSLHKRKSLPRYPSPLRTSSTNEGIQTVYGLGIHYPDSCEDGCIRMAASYNPPQAI